MAVTITLTPDPSTASVEVEVDGLGATPVVILRTGVDGAQVPLRGSPFTPVGGTVIAIDGEAPFGVSITYECEGVSAITSLEVDEPWITHPIAPYLSVPCVIQDDTDWTYQGRTYTFDVIGRTTPIYTWYRRSSRSGRLSIQYANIQERASILDALETGAPLLIRYPADYPQFPSAYLGIGEARIVPRGVGSVEGFVDLDYVVVAAPGSEVAVPGPDWTWAEVPTEYATWDDAVDAHPSWASLLFHNPVVVP